MERIKMGTIKGRHPLPVDGYIIDAVENPSDIDGIQHAVRTKMCNIFDNHISTKCGICYKSDIGLDLYVTGLTSVTAEIIAECAVNGIPLTLYHYNTQNGGYVPQVIFKGRE